MINTKPLSVSQLPRDYFARLHANGYSPIPNADKRCFYPNWPRVAFDPKWDRQRKFPAIGLRLDPPLCVVDVDVDDDELRPAMWGIITDLMGHDNPGLVRYGQGNKFAVFLRYGGSDGPFNRRQSPQYGRHPDDPKAPKFRVEVYGGGSPRQFGAFGPHSHDEHGNVLRTYCWVGPSPLDVPLADLPVLTKQQSYDVCDSAEAVFREWKGLHRIDSRSGDVKTAKAYDLTDDTVFTGPGGEELTLAGLAEAAAFAKVRGQQMRVTGSFTGDRASAGSLRALVSLSRDGLPVIHDTKTGITHRVAGTERKLIDASTDEGFAAIVAMLKGEAP